MEKRLWVVLAIIKQRSYRPLGSLSRCVQITRLGTFISSGLNGTIPTTAPYASSSGLPKGNPLHGWTGSTPHRLTLLLRCLCWWTAAAAAAAAVVVVVVVFLGQTERQADLRIAPPYDTGTKRDCCSSLCCCPRT